MQPLEQLVEHRLVGNPIGTWLLALIATAVAYGALLLLRRLLSRYLGRLAKRTATSWDDAVVGLIGRTHWVLLLALAVRVGAQFLELPTRWSDALASAVAILLVIQGGIWAVTLIGSYVTRYRETKLSQDPGSVTTVQVLGFLVRAAVWCVVGLLVLANAGIEITPLLAGLGVGGIAVALAVQTILKDLLASVSIMLDKPFVVGDFLILGEHLGSVEHIGIKTTRLRSLSGEQLVFPNGDLLDSRIRNFGRMRERRVVFKLGVTYQTPRVKLSRIPTIIREAVQAQPLTRFDRSHFKEYGDFSLNFETVYYVGVPDYGQYMDIQQAINLRIHEAFETEGIEFAYPTQTLFLAREGGSRD